VERGTFFISPSLLIGARRQQSLYYLLMTILSGKVERGPFSIISRILIGARRQQSL
jgi:hypothetical protein